MSSWRARKHPEHQTRLADKEIQERGKAPERGHVSKEMKAGHKIAKKLFDLIGERSGGRDKVLEKLVARAETSDLFVTKRYDDELKKAEPDFQGFALRADALMPHQAECIRNVLLGLSETGEGRVTPAHERALTQKQKFWPELMFNINGRAHRNPAHRGKCYDSSCDVVMPNMGTVKVATGGGKTIISGVINLLPIGWFDLPTKEDDIDGWKIDSEDVKYFLYPPFPGRLNRRAMVTCSSGALDEHRFMYQGYLPYCWDGKLGEAHEDHKRRKEEQLKLHKIHDDGSERPMSCSEMKPFLHRNAINLIRIVPALATKVRTRYHLGDSKVREKKQGRKGPREVPTDPGAYFKYVFPQDTEDDDDIHEVSLYFLLSEHSCVYGENSAKAGVMPATFGSDRYRRAAVVLFSLSKAYKEIASAYCLECKDLPCRGVLDKDHRLHDLPPIVPPEDFAVCFHDEPWREMSTQDIVNGETDLECITKTKGWSGTGRIKRAAAFEFAACKLALEITATGNPQRMYCNYPYAKLAGRGIVPQVQVFPLSTFGEYRLAKDDQNAALLRAVLCLDFVRDRQQKYKVPICAICATHSVGMADMIKQKIDSSKREHPFLPGVFMRVESLHSSMAQDQQRRIMTKFREHKLDMLLVHGMGAEGISNPFLKVVMVDRHVVGARLEDDWYTQIQGRGRHTPADKLQWLVNASSRGNLAEVLTDHEDREQAGWTEGNYPAVEFTNEHAREYFEKQYVAYLIPNEVAASTKIMEFFGERGQGWDIVRSDQQPPAGAEESSSPQYDTFEDEVQNEAGAIEPVSQGPACNVSEASYQDPASGGHGKRAVDASADQPSAKRCRGDNPEISMGGESSCDQGQTHLSPAADVTTSAEPCCASGLDPEQTSAFLDGLPKLAEQLCSTAERLSVPERQAARFTQDKQTQLEGMLRDHQWEIVRNDGADGDCLFYAVLDHIEDSEQSAREVRRLRQAIAKELEDKQNKPLGNGSERLWLDEWNRKLESELPLHQQAIDWKQLCRKIEGTSRWGGSLELYALAAHFKRQIQTFFVSARGDLQKDIYPAEACGSPITIAFFSEERTESGRKLEFSHYFSIRRPRDATEAQPHGASSGTGQVSRGAAARITSGSNDGKGRQAKRPAADTIEASVRKRQKEMKKKHRNQDLTAIFANLGARRPQASEERTFTDQRAEEEKREKEEQERERIRRQQQRRLAIKRQKQQETKYLKKHWSTAFCPGSQLQQCCGGSSRGVFCRKEDADMLVVEAGKPMMPESKNLDNLPAYREALESGQFAPNSELVVSYYDPGLQEKPPGAEEWPRKGALKARVERQQLETESGESKVVYIPVTGKGDSDDGNIVQVWLEFSYKKPHTCNACRMEGRKSVGGKVTTQLDENQLKGNAQQQLVTHVETSESGDGNAFTGNGTRSATLEFNAAGTTLTSQTEFGTIRHEAVDAPLKVTTEIDSGTCDKETIVIVQRGSERPGDAFCFDLVLVNEDKGDKVRGVEMLRSCSAMGVHELQHDLVTSALQPQKLAEGMCYHDPTELQNVHIDDDFQVRHKGITIRVSCFGLLAESGCRLLSYMVDNGMEISRVDPTKPKCGQRAWCVNHKDGKTYWGKVESVGSSTVDGSNRKDQQSVDLLLDNSKVRRKFPLSCLVAFHEDGDDCASAARKALTGTMESCLNQEGTVEKRKEHILGRIPSKVTEPEGLKLDIRQLAQLRLQLEQRKVDFSGDPQLS